MANPGNRGVGSMGGTSHTGGQGNRPEEQSVVGTIKDKASELASNVASSAEQAWDATRQTAQNVGSTVASSNEDAWDSVNSFMRRYPVATFFIGAGFGFLLAELFAPRRG